MRMMQVEKLLNSFTCSKILVRRKKYFRDIGARCVDVFFLGDSKDVSIRDQINHTDLLYLFELLTD